MLGSSRELSGGLPFLSRHFPCYSALCGRGQALSSDNGLWDVTSSQGKPSSVKSRQPPWYLECLPRWFSQHCREVTLNTLLAPWGHWGWNPPQIVCLQSAETGSYLLALYYTASYLDCNRYMASIIIMFKNSFKKKKRKKRYFCESNSKTPKTQNVCFKVVIH